MGMWAAPATLPADTSSSSLMSTSTSSRVRPSHVMTGMASSADGVAEAAGAFAAAGATAGPGAPPLRWSSRLVTGRRSGSRATGIVSQLASRLLWIETASRRGVPMPASTLIVSIAIAEPMLPHRAPMTPAVAQLGTDPGAGISGWRSRSVDPVRASKTASCPSKPRIVPHTRGIPSSSHASLTR